MILMVKDKNIEEEIKYLKNMYTKEELARMYLDYEENLNISEKEIEKLKAELKKLKEKKDE